MWTCYDRMFHFDDHSKKNFTYERSYNPLRRNLFHGGGTFFPSPFIITTNNDVYSPMEQIFNIETVKDNPNNKDEGFDFKSFEELEELANNFNKLDIDHRKKCAARYLWEFMSIHYIRNKIREEHNKNIENNKPGILTIDYEHKIEINSNAFKENVSIQEMIQKNTKERDKYLSSLNQNNSKKEKKSYSFFLSIYKTILNLLSKIGIYNFENIKENYIKKAEEYKKTILL